MPLDPNPNNEIEQLRRELYETKEQLSRINQLGHNALRDAQLDEALKPHGLQPDAAAQVKRLIEAEVRLAPDERGQTIAVGPGLTPVRDFVGQVLARPEMARFKTGATPRGTPFQPPAGEPRTLGEALLAQAQQARAAGGDPRTDMSRGFALGPGPTTPFAQQRDDGRPRS